MSDSSYDDKEALVGEKSKSEEDLDNSDNSDIGDNDWSEHITKKPPCAPLFDMISD